MNPSKWSNTVVKDSCMAIDDDKEQGKFEDFYSCVRSMEQNVLHYEFKNKMLLLEALTHSSCSNNASYQRLEFVGDAALGLAITNYVFLAYPNLDQGQLSLLRSANVSTEKLARVAIRHGFHKYVRHNVSLVLDEKIREFAAVVREEDYETAVYGGASKAPKILADIVESVAAAVYVDCDFDLKALWRIFRRLLEPIVTLDVLQKQPQPVTLLFELCQKNGKQLDIKHWRKGDRNIASVFVDGSFVASASSDQKDNAKLHAAEVALQKLAHPNFCDQGSVAAHNEHNVLDDIEGAKQKLHEFCDKKKWSKPIFKIEDEIGPAHERKYISSVLIETTDNVLFTVGKEKSRLRDAENSAASMILRTLLIS